MKSFLFIGITSIVGLFTWSLSQGPTQPVKLDHRKCVVNFNASFNKQNSYKWKTTPEAIYVEVDLSTNPQLKAKYKIKSLPTIMVLKAGSEVQRWEADLMFKLDVPQKEIIDFYKSVK
jgi:hypothetical protein